RAAKAAGFKAVSFQFEPVAAALDYEQRVDAETTALVVDIGGGTSDFTVTRLGPARRDTLNRSGDVLATTGIHIAGTDFDRLINLAQVMPLLGYGHVGAGGREVPSGIFFDLSTWHLIHHAYARKSVHQAQELWTSYTDLALHTRLMAVLNEHHGHRLLSHVEAAKIACSTSNAAVAIDVSCLHDKPGDTLHALLSPDALAQALHTQLAKIVACAQQCVAASGLKSVDAIYLTGGSSALRPLMDALQQVFPAASMVKGDLFGGVAAGLAYSGALKASKGQETRQALSV
ncbi:MAG: hypothetical protein RIS34_542, partial [Pseudomonadota bacterium]